MAKKKQIVKYFIAFLSLFFIVRCANQLPPGGGEIDKIPPEIIETYPENGTIKFNDDYISFTFSEYVDKRSVREAIFISPSIEGDIEYDWSGRTLDLEFDEPLKKNTTYTVTVGADIKDINNHNTMEEAFTLIFSTGAKLDSGVIAGKIYDDDPLGVYVFAYKIDSTEIDYFTQKPDYVSQVGENGIYYLKGLSSSRFSVIAVRDQFRDLVYNKEEDWFGIPFLETDLSSGQNEIFGVDFFLSREDTSKPHLFSATMTDANHIFLEFSEYVDSSLFSPENFFIYDSSSSKRIDVVHTFKGKSKPKEYFLSISDTLTQANSNYLILKSVKDLFGNETLNESVMFTVNSNPDTLVPKVERITTNNPSDKIDLLKPEIFIYFNDGVDLLSRTEAVKLLDSDSMEVKSKLEFIDNALILLQPEIKLTSNTSYFVSVNTRYFKDAAGNRGDTVIVKNLFTKNELDYSGISGKVLPVDSISKIVVLESLDEKVKTKRVLLQRASSNGEFNFDKLIPGKYLIWTFYDENENGKYDYGKLSPFTKSEKFSFYPDTLNLRARWPVGDVIIELDPTD